MASLSATAHSEIPTIGFPDSPGALAPLPLSTQDQEPLTFQFIEEPLGIPLEQGYGYLQIDFGAVIGSDRRFEIVRKLGWGMNASVWLARDTLEERFVAIKALNGQATELVSQGCIQELQVLQRVSSEPLPPGVHSTHCLSLLSQFIHPGEDGDGDHLCIVTDVAACDVRSLRSQFPDEILPLPLLKRVLRHVLLGIAHIHKCGIAHTDIKADNIVMDMDHITSEELLQIVCNDPPRRHPPEPSWGKQVEVAVSQPLPLPSLDQALSASFRLSDFGSAQFVDNPVTNKMTPPVLRPPEIILEGPWDETVDIWTFGCLIFEFVTGANLFVLKGKSKLRPEESHLLQMMCVTGERFMPKQLGASKKALEYFDPKTSRLKAWPHLIRVTYQAMMKTYSTLAPEDLDAAAALMTRCLCLNPSHRPSADELLNDPWLAEV